MASKTLPTVTSLAPPTDSFYFFSFYHKYTTHSILLLLLRITTYFVYPRLRPKSKEEKKGWDPPISLKFNLACFGSNYYDFLSFLLDLFLTLKTNHHKEFNYSLNIPSHYLSPLSTLLLSLVNHY